MKFDLVNDIHTDLWSRGPASIDWKTAQNHGSNVLILAGDTSNYIDELTVVLRQASDVYEHVIFTDGNHEHYFWGNDVDELESYLADLALTMPNVTYLNGQNTLQIGRTVFIGCNGWYDFSVNKHRYGLAESMASWLRGSNDPKMINFGDRSVRDRAINAAAQLTGHVIKLQDANVDIVAVTHTAPHSHISKWSKYTNSPYAVMDGAYYNTEMEKVFAADVSKRIKVWCYGHTHQRLDNMVEHVRCVNNARGYESERGEMGRWFVAQIDTEEKSYG